MSDNDGIPARSYGCSYGCGNPYDFVVVQVIDSSTLLLCSPCYVRTAMDMVEAFINPDSPEVQARLAQAGDVIQVPMDGRAVARRGHEAPGDINDPDAIDVFEGYVLEDEMPDEFRT